MSKVRISPIFYMGNKKKLIKKGLIDLFPKDIKTFVDVFGGSGVVSMNTPADNYIINDYDVHLFQLYNFFKTYSADAIVARIKSNISIYHLPTERTKRNQYPDKDKIEEYKKAYTEFRDYYNATRSIFDFYTLMFFSFSQQFRFNSKGEFNMPYGMDCFCDKNIEYIENGCDFFSRKNVKCSCLNFKWLLTHFDKNQFFYCDPPYYNTTAVYNENNGWTEDDERDLYYCLDAQSHSGTKWALSTVLENKGRTNPILEKWLSENDYNVYSFDGHTYSACGKGNSHAKEVLITNYRGGANV